MLFFGLGIQRVAGEHRQGALRGDSQNTKTPTRATTFGKARDSKEDRDFGDEQGSDGGLEPAEELLSPFEVMLAVG